MSRQTQLKSIDAINRVDSTRRDELSNLLTRKITDSNPPMQSYKYLDMTKADLLKSKHCNQQLT